MWSCVARNTLSVLKVLILHFNFVLCSYDYMSNLREEIKDLTKTLNQLSEERSNLLIALQTQEENYHHTFRKYEDCVETLLRQKDEKIETLFKGNVSLHAAAFGDNSQVLQYR